MTTAWESNVRKNGKQKATQLVQANGKKGWQVLVTRHFSGDIEAARQYAADLGRASFYSHTRPIFARRIMRPYWPKFPALAKKFNGER